MRNRFFLIAIIILMLVIGCSSSEESDETSAISNPPKSVDSIIGTPTTELTEMPSETSGSSLSDPTPPEPSEVVSSSAPAETSASTDEGRLLASYLGKIMPVVQRHITTKDTVTKAVQDFGSAAPSMEAVAAYAEALVKAKSNVDSEFTDASGIVPPTEYTDFHGTLVAAITKQRNGITSHLTYYNEVLAVGASDQSLFQQGSADFIEADRSWWTIVMPELEKLLSMAKP